MKMLYLCLLLGIEECIPCGYSILQVPRTYPVQRGHQERNILIQLVPLHLVSRLECVCAACWRSAMREVQRQQQRVLNRPTLADAGLNADIHIPGINDQ